MVRLVSLPLVDEIIENTLPRGTRVSLKNIFYDKSLIQDVVLREIPQTKMLPEAKQATLKMVRGAFGLHGIHRKRIMTEYLQHLDIHVLIA
jgi:hypothetical protein